MTKILFTGKDDFKYNRTRILLKGLLSNKEVEVILYPLNGTGFSVNEFRRKSEQADYVYIPPMRHSDVRTVRKMTRRPIIFDPLISKYLTRTIDHGKWWTAPEKYIRDYVAFKNSNIIMMDTECGKDWILEKFRLKDNAVFTLPVGVDTSVFKPEPTMENIKFTIGFLGSFIPLQGTDKIIEMARILRHEKGIQFDIIGDGPCFKRIRRLVDKNNLKNICFRGWVNYNKINTIINSYDLCLGIFGNSIKTNLVIPNKVYHYAAIGKCIMTKNTPAIKEIFTDGQDIQLTSSEPEEMAATAIDLRNMPEKRESLGKATNRLIVGKYNEEEIAAIFINNIKKWEESKNKKLAF